MRTKVISLIGTLELVVSGHGQSYSPGHSRKYPTYSNSRSKQRQDKSKVYYSKLT